MDFKKLDKKLSSEIKKGNRTRAKELMDLGADIRRINQSNETLLHVAAKNNRIACLKLCIEHNLEIEQRDINGNTALNVSAAYGHFECVEYLIQQGANVNSRNNNDESSLFLATCKNYTGRNGYDLCIEMLIKNGAEINAVTHDTHSTPLHAIAPINHEATIYLVQQGIQIDLKNKEGATALHLAAAGFCYKTVRYLIEHGANPLLKDNTGESAIEKIRKKDEFYVLQKEQADMTHAFIDSWLEQRELNTAIKAEEQVEGIAF